MARQGQAEGTGVLGEWKAREAEMQTLADRADATRRGIFLLRHDVNVFDTIFLLEFHVPWSICLVMCA